MSVQNATLLGRNPLYERLAADISRQIEQGTYRPGTRLPSVRQSSRQRGLSITTVLQAYQLLEDRGLIEARPQSGYYVRARPVPLVAEPTGPSLDCVPHEVKLERLALQITRDANNPALIQFGSAIPAPDLLPTARLNRTLAGLARRGDTRQYLCGIPEGVEELRVQVARRSATLGCNLSPDELIITAGCQEAISLSLSMLCRPGDLVAVESPPYFGILQTLEVQGLRALEIPTHPETGMSLEALRFAVENHPVKACVVVTNFSNPLGCCMPAENKRELVEILAEHEIPLIEDDIYGELYFGEERPNCAKAYDKHGLVLLCSSFSKDISPSFRIGWIAPGKFIDQFAQIKLTTNIGTPILTQLAVANFLESGGYDHHLRRIRREYAERTAGMAHAVTRYFPEGTRVSSPAGGFVLWVQMPESVDSLALYQRAIQAGITFAPGYMFSTGAKYRNYIRLNAANWSYALLSGVQRLGNLAKEMVRD